VNTRVALNAFGRTAFERHAADIGKRSRGEAAAAFQTNHFGFELSRFTHQTLCLQPSQQTRGASEPVTDERFSLAAIGAQNMN
jgi:hypothetical protein